MVCYNYCNSLLKTVHLFIFIKMYITVENLLIYLPFKYFHFQRT